MASADEKRLFEGFSRATRGPSGLSVDRLNNTLGSLNLASQAILTPGAFLDVKAQAADMAKRAFSKSFSDLNQFEKQALVKQLAWRQAKVIKQEPISPQEDAASWSKILKEAGL